MIYLKCKNNLEHPEWIKCPQIIPQEKITSFKIKIKQ